MGTKVGKELGYLLYIVANAVLGQLHYSWNVVNLTSGWHMQITFPDLEHTEKNRLSPLCSGTTNITT